MRTRLSIVSAGLGASLIVAFALGAPAGAAGETLPIYESRANGHGVLIATAVRPSILESAIQAGTMFGSVSFNSQGDGVAQSIAAPLYPGPAAMGALTGPTACGGVKGWVEARYPPTTRCPGKSSDFLVEFGIDQLDAVTGDMEVTAGLARGTSDLVANGFEVRPGASDPPILRVGSIDVAVDGARAGAVLTHVSKVVAKDVRLLNDAVVIGAITSHAVTTTDGVTSTADASVSFADVTVTVNGDRHRAEVTDTGVRVNDPELSHEQNLGLTETVQDALLQAGITIASAAPVEITEGATAESAAGGLSIALSGTLPAVPVPAEAAQVIGPVIEQIPTTCVYEVTHGDDPIPPLPPEIPPVPLCFGAGVLPGPGSQLVATFSIANASSFSVAARTPVFESPTGGPGPFTPPTVVGPGTFTPPPSGPGIAGGPPEEPISPAPVVEQPLVGLVSNMPDWALALAGGLLLAFAFGLVVAPSLGHGRTG